MGADGTIDSLPAYATSDYLKVKVVGASQALSVTPPGIGKTMLKTYLLDPTSVAGPDFVQIASYEPNRVRMTVRSIDQDVVITKEPPVVSPDTSSITQAPTGLQIAHGAIPAEHFYGPDAFWVNTLSGTGATRVVVKKEYL